MALGWLLSGWSFGVPHHRLSAARPRPHTKCRSGIDHPTSPENLFHGGGGWSSPRRPREARWGRGRAAATPRSGCGGSCRGSSCTPRRRATLGASERMNVRRAVARSRRRVAPDTGGAGAAGPPAVGRRAHTNLHQHPGQPRPGGARSVAWRRRDPAVRSAVCRGRNAGRGDRRVAGPDGRSAARYGRVVEPRARRRRHSVASGSARADAV